MTPTHKKLVAVMLSHEQIAFVDEVHKASGLSKSEIIRQSLDAATPELIKKHGLKRKPKK